MKQINSWLYVAAAAMSVLSCAKDVPVKIESKGTPVEIVVEDADIEDPDTKISWGNESGKRPKWDAGDRFQLIAYTHNTSAAQSVFTSWGDFVTQDGSTNQYNSNTTFSGYKPDGFSTETGGQYFAAIAKNPTNSSYTLSHESNRYVFTANVPAEQDGTGFKYSVMAAYFNYADGVFSTTGSSTFYPRTALCALALPEGSNVTRIDITLSYTLSDANQFLASNGSKQDVKFCLVNGWGVGSTYSLTLLSGGGSKTISIYNNGAVLPETPNKVYWASIRTQSGSATYGCGILTFRFTNTDGKVATKVVELYKDSNGDHAYQSTEKVNVTAGNRLNNFGSVTFQDSDWE